MRIHRPNGNQNIQPSEGKNSEAKSIDMRSHKLGLNALNQGAKTSATASKSMKEGGHKASLKPASAPLNIFSHKRPKA